jgi:hypothetical protein
MSDVVEVQKKVIEAQFSEVPETLLKLINVKQSLNDLIIDPQASQLPPDLLKILTMCNTTLCSFNFVEKD